MRYICTVNNLCHIFDDLWVTLSQQLRIGLRFWKYDRIRSVISDILVAAVGSTSSAIE